ncbi:MULTISPECIES: hypothetical protein [unclassified Geodermatophilus]
MSEADNAWRVTLDGRQRDIEVRHDTLTGEIVVTLDGSEVGEDRMVARDKAVDFAVGDHVAVVSVAYAQLGLSARSALHLDGRYVEPLRR